MFCMELECVKYNEKMQAENAFCRHPGDYCKYRTSCMIQFMSGENKTDMKSAQQSDNSSHGKDTPNKK